MAARRQRLQPYDIRPPASTNALNSYMVGNLYFATSSGMRLRWGKKSASPKTTSPLLISLLIAANIIELAKFAHGDRPMLQAERLSSGLKIWQESCADRIACIA